MRVLPDDAPLTYRFAYQWTLATWFLLRWLVIPRGFVRGMPVHYLVLVPLLHVPLPGCAVPLFFFSVPRSITLPK